MRHIFLFLTALLFAGAAQGAEPTSPYTDYAVTTGEFEKEYAPDEIYLNIVIRERDSKGKISIEEQQQQLFEALRTQGIDVDKALKIKELSSAYSKKGNLAFGRYEFKLSTPEAFFAAYTACDNLGLSDVSLSRIDRSDKEALRCSAAAQAMQTARCKADSIATAAGRKVGKCFFFADEVSAYSVTPQLMGMAAGISFDKSDAGTAAKAAFLPEIGTVNISASVQAKFVLE